MSTKIIMARPLVAGITMASRRVGCTGYKAACSTLPRRLYSLTSPQTVPLVYDLHEPPTPTVPNNKTSPIIVMHGLFGSKKNNRSISK